MKITAAGSGVAHAFRVGDTAHAPPQLLDIQRRDRLGLREVDDVVLPSVPDQSLMLIELPFPWSREFSTACNL